MNKHILQKLRCVITMILVMAITLSTAVTPIKAFERLPDAIATDSNASKLINNQHIATPSDAIEKEAVYRIQYENSNDIWFDGPDKVSAGHPLEFIAYAADTGNFTVYVNGRKIIPEDKKQAGDFETATVSNAEQHNNATISDADESETATTSTPSEPEYTQISYCIKSVDENIVISAVKQSSSSMKVIFIDENGNEVTDIMEYNATDVIRDGDIISSREFFENLTDSDAVHGAYDMSGAEIMELRMENGILFYERSDQRSYMAASNFSQSAKRSRYASNTDSVEYDGRPIYLLAAQPKAGRGEIDMVFHSTLSSGDSFIITVTDFEGFFTQTAEFIFPDPEAEWKDGDKTFIGWKEEGEGELYIPNEDSITLNKPWGSGTTRNFYAIYGTSITYSPNGGTGTEILDETPHGTSVILPQKPDGWNKKDGDADLEFLGWSQDPQASITESAGAESIFKEGENFIIPSNTENITLYAIYDNPPQNVSITFNPNGAYGASFQNMYQAGSSINLPEKPDDWTYSGMEFIGWCIKPDGNGNLDNNHDTVIYNEGELYLVPESGQVTLYALWGNVNFDATFFVRLDGLIPQEPGTFPASEYTSGITIDGAIKVKRFIADVTGKKVVANLNSLPTDEQLKQVIENAGKTYDPKTQEIIWYVMKDQGGNTYLNVDGALVDKTKISLSYDPNAPAGTWTGTVPMARQYFEGETVVVENGSGFSRLGYVFSGWNTRADGRGTSYAPDDPITLTENTVLYAMWTAESRTSFYANSTLNGSYDHSINNIVYRMYTEAGEEIILTGGGQASAEFEFANSAIRDKTYYLVQELPEEYDYLIADKSIYRITINANNQMSFAISVDGGINYNEYVPAAVYNSPYFVFDNIEIINLPETGGSGIFWFYASGMSCMLSCLVLIRFKKAN